MAENYKFGKGKLYFGDFESEIGDLSNVKLSPYKAINPRQWTAELASLFDNDGIIEEISAAIGSCSQDIELWFPRRWWEYVVPTRRVIEIKGAKISNPRTVVADEPDESLGIALGDTLAEIDIDAPGGKPKLVFRWPWKR